MYNSNLTQISSELIRKILCDVVEDQLNTNVFQININSCRNTGDNFGGSLYRVLYHSLDNDDDNDTNKNSSLYMKLAPDERMQRKENQSRELFLREIYLYDEILSCFRQFEESKSIDEEDSFHEYAKCYKTINIEPIECIFLQDMTQDGFTLLNQCSDEITTQHVILVMRMLGKLHACSLALKDQKPEIFSAMIAEIEPNTFKYRTYKFANMLTFTAKTVVNTITDENDSFMLRKLLKFYERTQYDILLECIDGSRAEPHSSIIHGDCCSNNTFFKRNENNQPVEVCAIDWKSSKYCSPICDVVQYIFCSTTKEQRDNYYDSFLQTYHESLSNQLIRLGSDPFKVFSYQAMLDQLHNFGCYGLIVASYTLPQILSGNIIDMNKMFENEESHETEQIMSPEVLITFNSRMRDIVYDMVRLDYINEKSLE